MPTSLGEKINILRKQKNWTFDQLSAATETSRSYLWELEQNRIPRPSAEKLQRIAAALDVTASFLVDNDKNDPGEDSLDQAFFRKYRKLSPETKQKMRDLIDVWSNS
ncbi:MAG: helix-turn-helix transcriptional regulator [Magnetococcales bacterium]|nr:helix-turn-helix transcriptional regulator [Magnetococcales bacterium]